MRAPIISNEIFKKSIQRMIGGAVTPLFINLGEVIAWYTYLSSSSTQVKKKDIKKIALSYKYTASGGWLYLKRLNEDVAKKYIRELRRAASSTYTATVEWLKKEGEEGRLFQLRAPPELQEYLDAYSLLYAEIQYADYKSLSTKPQLEALLLQLVEKYNCHLEDKAKKIAFLDFITSLKTTLPQMIENEGGEK